MDNTVEEMLGMLNRQEKVHFSRFIKMHKNNELSNYSQLFAHINKEGKIVLKDLQKKNSKAMLSKYISAGKELLLEKILLSLVNYHFDSAIYRRIIKDILFINLLLERGLNKKASKYIKRVKALAYRYEEFSLLLLIIELEENMMFSFEYITNYNKLNKLRDERLQIIEIINNLKDFRILKGYIQDFQLKNDKIYISGLDELKDFSGFHLLSEENNALCTKAKNIWYYLNFYIHSMSRDNQKAMQMCNKELESYQYTPEFINEDEYFQIVVNSILTAARLKDEPVFYRLHQLLTDPSIKNEKNKYYIEECIYLSFLELYHCIDQKEKALEAAIEAENYVIESLTHIEARQIKWISSYIIREYIQNNNYEVAFNYLKKIKSPFQYQYYDAMIKYYEFIVNYKTGKSKILEYSVNSWSKVIQKRRKLYKVEKALFHFFRSVDEAITLGKEKNLIEKTLIKLKLIRNDPAENFYFEHFDFVGWFERELGDVKMRY